MKKVILLAATIALASCVSKKKYVALEQEHAETRSLLQKTAVERDELKSKMTNVEQRVEAYYDKINSLKEEVNEKMSMSDDGTIVVSNAAKEKMRATLSNVSASQLSTASTLKDSMNLAITYNLTKSLTDDIKNDENIDISIDQTVVMINLSDKFLFKSGSFRINKKADEVLSKIAEVIKSEPSIDVMVEGHTDSRPYSRPNLLDNWDLSVKRATSVVRKLQKTHGVDPSKMIASGRGSFVPLVPNDNAENQARNRRTRIVILPNLDKFLALMATNE
ncbi:OmpA family protein [Sungkyunkwania multivorans]|uniref:OmpA family protein n=1 Tax=Sungkyunkwania multivorans TaxID=1173618 RepID=A0ABW3CYS6_9FLAO